MAAKKRSSLVLIRLKNVLTKLNAIFLVQLRRLCLAPRRAPRRLPSVSYGDRTLGPTSCLEDETTVGANEHCSARSLERASGLSYENDEDDIDNGYENDEDDIDKRSQIFIDNFRHHLWLERQVSLRLRRYNRFSSSGTEDGESSSPCYWSAE